MRDAKNQSYEGKRRVFKKDSVDFRRVDLTLQQGIFVEGKFHHFLVQRAPAYP